MNYTIILSLFFAMVLAVGCQSDNNKTTQKTVESNNFGGLSSLENILPIDDESIAYVASSRKRDSIRLIKSDGSDDRLLWKAPENLLISPAIGTLAWRLDGKELAFDSDHNFGMSYYGRDLYTITADGSYLRKITNPPEIKYFESSPKGTVKFNSENHVGSGGANFWAYIEGSSHNTTWLAASWEKFTLTFDDVVDFGSGVRQHAVVGHIGYNNRRLCRYDLAGFADVKSGNSVEIIQELDTWTHTLQHCLTVRQPSWNHNGEKILYTITSQVDAYSDGPTPEKFENYNIMLTNTEKISPGNKGSSLGLFESSYHSDPRYIKLSPLPDNKVLMVIYNFNADRIYLSSTNDSDIAAPDRLERVDLGFCNYGDDPSYSVDTCRVSDIEWLADGSGFIVSMYVGNKYAQQKFDTYRIYKHDFKTKTTDMLVSLNDEYIGNITISSDAKKIAFERGVRNDGPYDIWIYDIVNDNLSMLVQDGAAPAWGS